MANGMFYVGQTHDVAKRLERHASGHGSRMPNQLKEFSLVFTEGPLQHEAAIQRERKLKKWSRSKKIALIRGDFDTLKALSKSLEA